MKVENIASLYAADYNISELIAMRQRWQTNSIFKMETQRETGCLLYFCGCSAEYTFNNKHLFVPKDAIVYIPPGQIYTTRFSQCETNSTSTILINFSLLNADNEVFALAEEPIILRQKADLFLDGLFQNAADLLSSAVVSIPSLKIVVYQILTELSREKYRQTLYTNKFLSIAEGILCLENDPQCKLRIEEIADKCHVSPATFRRLFKEYAGVSPGQYRLAAKMEYAKKLLRMGTMSGLQISDALSYDDYAYFCRVFKQYTGMTPGTYRQ